MWRSEPQIAVVVMRMMASRGFRIAGSGTRSTRTSSFPYQQRACTSAFSLGLPVGGGDLARLHGLLEAPQVLADLDVWFFAEQLGDHHTGGTGGRIVGQLDVDLGASTAGCRLEAY